MKISRIPRYLNNVMEHPEILLGSKKYLFLVSHMRSFSTLTSHLLGSSNDINGYKENHMSYDSILDLYLLRYKTQRAIESDLSGSYIHDKVLHNYASISEGILRRQNVRIIFTIRKPADTVKSIVNMGMKLVDNDWYTDQEKVAAYYEERLDEICKYAPVVGNKGVYMDAEAIISDSEDVVRNLSEWLDLKQALTTEYKRFKHTGEAWHGDPSKNILEGKIVSKKKSYEVEVNPEIEARLNEAYANAREEILKHCPNVLDLATTKEPAVKASFS